MIIEIRVPAEPGTVYARNAFAKNIGRTIELLVGAVDGEHPRERVFGTILDAKTSPARDAVTLTIEYE